jgi:hypothetical protein
MKNKPEEFTCNIHEKYFEKDGKFFIQKNWGVRKDNIAFIEVDKKEYYENLHKVAKMIAKATKLTAEEIIFAALKSTDLKTVEEFKNAIKKKKKVVRKNGCIQLEAGGATLVLAG